MTAPTYTVRIRRRKRPITIRGLSKGAAVALRQIMAFSNVRTEIQPTVKP